MTVRDLKEYLEEFDDDADVFIAYQPNYPIAAEAGIVKFAKGTGHYGQPIEGVFIGQGSSGNFYAPDSIYDDSADGDDDHDESDEVDLEEDFNFDGR